MKGETTMKKLAMKMLSLLLVLSLLLPTCVFAQPGQDEDGTPGTSRTTSEETTTFTEGGNGGGNGDGDAGAPTGGGNSDEDADAPTGGGNGDGDADVTEEPTVATVSIAVAAEDDGISQEELLEGYLYSISGLYGEGAAVFRAPSKPLPGELQTVYAALQPMIRDVAGGSKDEATFALTNTWTKTKADWGFSGNLTETVGGTTVLTTAAANAIQRHFKVDELLQRLLSTMPYDLYWFDKTEGMLFGFGAVEDSSGNVTVSNVTYHMAVSSPYSDTTKTTTDSTGKTYVIGVNTTKTSAVSTAVTNATNIVNANSTKRDYEKLKAYLSEICNRVEYNHAAAGSSYTGGYGDPWQLIYVFDNDSSTNVVCEGYAKAFKYLCDLSTFSDTNLSCYLVTGNMTGGTGEGGSGAGGGHMWNVVHIGGNNYLVDVTNCDTGTIGATDKLFLCGVEGQTVGESYHVTIGSDVISFSYDAATKDNYTLGELTLSGVTYEEPAMPALGGTVTITGASSPNPKIGDTLTANTGSLNYNGATAGTLSYQWKAGGGNVGSNSDKYTVQVGDYNKKITVTVTSSSNTGSVSSAETAAVVKKDGPSAPTGSITVKNITAEGFTYTAIAGRQYAISTSDPIPAGIEWGAKVATDGDVVVTGKNANTDYYIYTRVAETDEAYAGAASGGTKVKTRMSAAASEFTYSTKEAVYTGSANGATVSSVAHNSSEFTLKYNGADTAPTNVGKYALTAEVKAHDDYAATTVELGTWEIKPLEVTLTWNNIADRTYDGNNSNVTAIVSNKAIAADEVNVTVTGGTEANAGSHTATAAALTGAAASNYKLPDTKPTQAYIINAATITVTGAFTSYTGVYDGNPHSITVDRSKIETKGGQEFTIEYSADGGSTYGAALPEITNVNESPKTVHYKITAPNHAARTGTATITINQATQTISGGDFSVKVGKTVNLDEKFSAQGALTYSITGANTTGSSVSGKVLTVGATTGSFTLKVDAAATGNYNAATKNVTVTVTAKEVQTITAGDVSATYGDTNAKVVGSSNGDGAITYAVTGVAGVVEVDSNTGALTIKKAGAATVTITAAETGDYATATKSVTINVAQKDVTITGLGAANKVYDGNTTATVTGTADVAGKVGSDDVTVTGGTATFADKNVGTGKTVTFTSYTLSGTAAGNYNLTAQPASVTAEITAKEVTVTGITATNRTYAKDNLEVTLNGGTLSGVISGDAVNVDLTNAKGKMANANAGNGKAVTVTGVALGGADKGNYRLKEQPTGVTVDIAQAATPAAPTGLNGVKGNALSTVALPAGWTWVNGSTVMNSVGSHNFKANYTDAAGNYASAANVDVTVNVKDKTDVSGKISFNDGTLVYTGAGQRYETATISGITAGTGVTWTYGYTAGTGTLDGGLPMTAGTYTATVTYEDSLHYGTKSVTLTITQATPTGAPKFTKITSSGKTLGDAALVKAVSGPGDGFSVAGTVEWVDGSGTALADSTSVEANKSYGWKFTPADSNYKSISGSVVVYTVRRVSHSGGAAADSAAAAAAQPTVYSGSRGESVKTLQERLNAKGYNAGSVDGIFGKNTQAAVMAFQKANGLAADGIVGKLTWAKLYDTTAALPAASTATGTQPMVYRGSRGDAVRRLQELLNKKGFDCGAVDGIFGSKTYAAVVAFQKANGLGADGIVGPLTWGKLG